MWAFCLSDCRIARVYSGHLSPRLKLISPQVFICPSRLLVTDWRCSEVPVAVAAAWLGWPALARASSGNSGTPRTPPLPRCLAPPPPKSLLLAPGMQSSEKKFEIDDSSRPTTHLRILPIHALSDLSLAKSPPPCPPHSYSTRRPSRGYAKSRSARPTRGQTC
jgi:hypothetical protein